MTTGSDAGRPPVPVRGVTPLTLVGMGLLMLGVVSIGWVGWQYYGTNITANKAFSQERDALRERWESPHRTPAERPAPGDSLALLRIPELGADFEYPIIAGVTDADLGRGVGWYPTSAPPGEVGNVALAGHRITHGEPFARLLELEVGSRVVLETRDAVHTYELTTAPAALTVGDQDTWVVDPVPGQPAGTQPTERLLTLTTCTDLFASPKRSVAFGRLVETVGK